MCDIRLTSGVFGVKNPNYEGKRGTAYLLLIYHPAAPREVFRGVADTGSYGAQVEEEERRETVPSEGPQSPRSAASLLQVPCQQPSSPPLFYRR